MLPCQNDQNKLLTIRTICVADPLHDWQYTQHYSAYYDMLRHGYRFALVMEDDATYADGTKIGDRKGSKHNHRFSVHLGYGEKTFGDVLRKVSVCLHVCVSACLRGVFFISVLCLTHYRPN